MTPRPASPWPFLLLLCLAACLVGCGGNGGGGTTAPASSRERPPARLEALAGQWVLDDRRIREMGAEPARQFIGVTYRFEEPAEGPGLILSLRRGSEVLAGPERMVILREDPHAIQLQAEGEIDKRIAIAFEAPGRITAQFLNPPGMPLIPLRRAGNATPAGQP